MAVDADVGDATAGANELGAELERLGDADRLDRDVRAEAAGQLHDLGNGIDRSPLLIVTSAPNSRARASRESSMSIATMCAGV